MEFEDIVMLQPDPDISLAPNPLFGERTYERKIFSYFLR
jgi:hypothetical protein